MAVLKCKMCGGSLEVDNEQGIAVCEYCGTKQTLPKLDDEHKATLYDRASHFRRNNEFDKAMGIYEQILNEDDTDAESYWSIILCKYGIEYVEDPATHKRMPTVNRIQYTSVFADENYQAALEHATGAQKLLYEEEAHKIDEIQKEFLKISSKEEPFDVFICYKESSNSGARTTDSVMAQDIYYQLVGKGFKVFFARITLESKLGQQYEPYIFAALNSAKVMIVVGTKPEYFNAVWVKNEWSRFLMIAQEHKDRLIIPAYKDMDPYDLPDALSYYQALDMSKIGFIQDLIHGVEKVLLNDKPVHSAERTVSVAEGPTSNAGALLKRGKLELEDHEWQKAYEYFDQVLNIDAECSEAYLGQAFAKYKVSSETEYINSILQSTQDVEKTAHFFPELQDFYNKEVQRLREANISFSPEMPEFVYYTEAEGREEQLQKVRSDFNNDKYISKAIRFSANDQKLFSQIETALFAEMENRIKVAKENDSVEQNRILEEINAWKDALVSDINNRIQQKKDEMDREYEKMKRQLESGEVVNLVAMRRKFELMGNVGDSPRIVAELTEKIQQIEEERKKLQDEYHEIIAGFSVAQKSLLGKNSKKYKELEIQLRKVQERLQYIESSLSQ